MENLTFPECNVTMRPPKGLEEPQCFSMPAYRGTVEGGSLDGLPISVVAWKPTAAELAAIMEGKPIYISFIGGTPPHYPSMGFHEATHPG